MNFRPLLDHETGDPYLPVHKRGDALLHDSFLNKGEAFSREERRVFGLEGLLPDHVATMDEQLVRVRNQLEQKQTDLEKFPEAYFQFIPVTATASTSHYLVVRVGIKPTKGSRLW